MHQPLQVTLENCGDWMQQIHSKFEATIEPQDFVLSFSDLFTDCIKPSFTHAILNPPYKKINSESAHRQALRGYGIETSNLYSAFVSLALLSLEDGGELVAITPRSFCNGSYFRPFRELILAQSALVKVHLFESRKQAFKGDDVLQENIIFHLIKGATQGAVQISSSEDAIALNDDTRKWLMPTGCYVAMRRLSSKEEKRRIVPAVFTPRLAKGDWIGFDNKTNIVHQDKHGMCEDLAKGMAIYLGATFTDQWLRRFSGHTQVNAGDLRALRYPDIDTLMSWGKTVTDRLPTQAEIDAMVGGI